MSSLVKSSAFMLATKLFQKSLGLISTIILARILMPEDFGIVAFLALTTALFQVMSETGNIQYIITKNNLDDDDLNTALTLEVITKGSFWLLLVILTPQIAHFFNMTEATDALYVLSTTLLIKALKNPGFNIYQRDLNYSYLFKLEMIAKFSSFAAVIILAYSFKSYWAIVVGDVISALVLTLGSYILHSFKPKFSLKRMRDQWQFSKWMFMRGIVGYAKANIDQLTITKMFSPSTAGQFYLAKDLALMPAYHFLVQASSPLLSSYSQSNNDRAQYSKKVNLSLFAINLAAILIATYLFIFASQIIYFILGEKWIAIEPYFKAFIPLMYLASITPIFAFVCTSKHAIKWLFYSDLMYLSLLASAYFFIVNDEILQFIWARVVVHALVVLLILYKVKQLTTVSLVRQLYLLLPVLLVCSLVSLLFSKFIHLKYSFLEFVMYSSVFFIATLTFTCIGYLLFYKDRSEVDFFRQKMIHGTNRLKQKFGK